MVNLAVLALASERFRLDHGRWPKLARELVPSYIEAVPYDPHTGKDLCWKPTDRALDHLLGWAGWGRQRGCSAAHPRREVGTTTSGLLSRTRRSGPAGRIEAVSEQSPLLQHGRNSVR